MTSFPVLLSIGLLAVSSAAFADDDLYKTKNCMACHRVDRNTLGPSFKNIAAKYAEESGADVKLAQKIQAGGVGVWGSVPMPAQAQVSDTEALTLSRWILQLK